MKQRGRARAPTKTILIRGITPSGERVAETLPLGDAGETVYSRQQYEALLSPAPDGEETSPRPAPQQGGYRRAGLGDVIAWLARRVGIQQLQHCGCKDRQAWLNRHVPLPPLRVRKTGDPTLDGESVADPA